MRTILPGDKISDTPMRIENALVEDGKTYATVIGMLDEEKGTFIPLESVWYPREGDYVIGIVENAKNRVYTIDLESPFKGLVLPPPRPRFRDMRQDRGERQEVLEIGDIVSAFVREVKRESDQIILILDRPRRLMGGKLVEVRPSKVPRVLGRANTMLTQLQDMTKSTMLVGLNGLVWLKGGNIQLAQKAIAKIQDEAHVSGLTERIKEMLNANSASGASGANGA